MAAAASHEAAANLHRLLQSQHGISGLHNQSFELAIDALHARLFRTTDDGSLLVPNDDSNYVRHMMHARRHQQCGVIRPAAPASSISRMAASLQCPSPSGQDMIDAQISLPLGDSEWFLQLRWLLHQQGTDMTTLVNHALQSSSASSSSQLPPPIVVPKEDRIPDALSPTPSSVRSSSPVANGSTPMVVLACPRSIQRAYLDFLIFVNTHATVASEEWRVQWTDTSKKIEQPTVSAAPTTVPSVDPSLGLATVPEDDASPAPSPHARVGTATPATATAALRVDIEPVAARVVSSSPMPMIMSDIVHSPTTSISSADASPLSSPVPSIASSCVPHSSAPTPLPPNASPSPTPPLVVNRVTPSPAPLASSPPPSSDERWHSPLLPSRLFVDSRSSQHRNGDYLHLDSIDGWLLMLLLEHEIILKLLHAGPFGKLQVHASTLPILSGDRASIVVRHPKHTHLTVGLKCYDFHTILAISFSAILHDFICPRSSFVINAALHANDGDHPLLGDDDHDKLTDSSAGVPLLSLLAAHLSAPLSANGSATLQSWDRSAATPTGGVRLPWERVIPLSVASLAPRMAHHHAHQHAGHSPNAKVGGATANLMIAPSPSSPPQQSLVHAALPSSVTDAHHHASISAVSQRRSRSAQAAASITRLRSQPQPSLVSSSTSGASSTVQPQVPQSSPLGGGGSLVPRATPRTDGNEPDLAARIHAAMMFQPATPLPAAGRPTRTFVDRLAAAYPPSASITAPPGSSVAPQAARRPPPPPAAGRTAVTTADGRPLSARVHRSNLRTHVMPVADENDHSNDEEKTIDDASVSMRSKTPGPAPQRGSGQRRHHRPMSASNIHRNGLATTPGIIRSLPNTVLTHGVANPSWSVPTFQPKGWMNGLDRAYVPVTAKPMTVLPHRPDAAPSVTRTPVPPSIASPSTTYASSFPPQPPPSMSKPSQPLPESLPDHYRTPPAAASFYSRSVLLTASEPTLKSVAMGASRHAKRWQVQGRPKPPGPASQATFGVALTGLGITDHSYDPSDIHNMHRTRPVTLDPGPAPGMTHDGRVARLEELAERRRRRTTEMERRKQKGWSRIASIAARAINQQAPTDSPRTTNGHDRHVSTNETSQSHENNTNDMDSKYAMNNDRDTNDVVTSTISSPPSLSIVPVPPSTEPFASSRATSHLSARRQRYS